MVDEMTSKRDNRKSELLVDEKEADGDELDTEVAQNISCWKKRL
jgi:hypothetical protein